MVSSSLKITILLLLLYLDIPFPRWLWPLPLLTLMVDAAPNPQAGDWQGFALLSLIGAVECLDVVLVRSS